MIVQNNRIDVFVIPYRSFIEEHGTTSLDNNIMKTYKKSTGREKVKRVCSSIQGGYIFAWVSPFPQDVKRDFQFSLSLDYEAIKQQYEATA